MGSMFSITQRINRLVAAVESKSIEPDANHIHGYIGRELEFAQEELGAKLWGPQRAFIEGILEHRLVSWRSGRKNGKTYALAVLVLTFIFTRPSIVITLGSTGRQVREFLWGEIRRVYDRANTYRRKVGKPDLPGRGPDMAQLKLGPKHYAVGFSTDQPTRIQGVHAEVVVPDDPDADVTPEELAELHATAALAGDLADLLIITDETPGIDNRILEAIKGSISGPNAYFAMAGNPTLGEDEHHEFVASHKPGSAYLKIRSSSLPVENDNLTPDLSFDHVPTWLLDPAWIDARKREWGEDSPLYFAHVMGMFAGAGVRVRVISRELLVAALGNKCGAPLGRQIGVDIADQGDDACVASLWHNGVKVGEHTWSGGGVEGLMETVGVIESLRIEWAAQPAEARKDPKGYGIPASNIHVDATGVGAGVVSRLAQRGLYVDAVDFGASPEEDWDSIHGETLFANRKAELKWTLRRALQEGLAKIPEHYVESWDELQWESHGLKERATGTVIQIEKKEDVKLRHGRSPDHADADALAWSRATLSGVGVTWF